MARLSLIALVAAACARDLPVDVHGHVVGRFGVPVGDVLVSVAGRPAVRTGADGSFSFDAVQPPYDLVLRYGTFGEGQDTAAVVAWLGLHRADLVLSVPRQAAIQSSGACATVTGATGLSSAEQIAVQLHTGYSSSFTAADASGAACAFGLWSGSQSISATLHAFRLEYDSPQETRVKAITAYGRSEPFTLNQDLVTNGLSVGLEPVATKNLHLSAVPQAGTTGSLDASLFVEPQPDEADLSKGLRLLDGNLPGPFDVPFPDLPGALVAVSAESFDPEGRHVLISHFVAGGGSWEAVMPQVPALLSPDDGAAFDPAMRLEWEARDGLSVHAVSLTQIDRNANFNVLVVTENTSVVLPDFSVVGEPISALPGDVRWGVTGFGPGSIDDVIQGGLHDSVMTESAPRQFAPSF